MPRRTVTPPLALGTPGTAPESLLSLPTELLLLILDQFDVLELIRLRVVSNDMRWIVDRSIALQTHHSFVLCRFRHAGFLHFLSRATSLRRLVLLYAEPAYDWGWAECLSVPRVQETLISLEAYPWPSQCGMYLIAPLLSLQALRLESTEEQDLVEDRFYLGHLPLRSLSLRWFTGVAELLREAPLEQLTQIELKLPEGAAESDAAEVEAILDELAERLKGRGSYCLVVDSADGTSTVTQRAQLTHHRTKRDALGRASARIALAVLQAVLPDAGQLATGRANASAVGNVMQAGTA